MKGGVLALAAGAALVLLVIDTDGWIEAVAAIQLWGLCVVFWITGRWAEQSYDAIADLTGDTVEWAQAHRDFGERVSDVNADAVIALNEHDPERAAHLAGKFLDAYSVYRERVPD